MNGDYAYSARVEPVARRHAKHADGSYVAVRSRRAVKHVLQLKDDGERGLTDHLRELEAASRDQSVVSRSAPRTHRGGVSGGAPAARHPTCHQLGRRGTGRCCCSLVQ